MLQFNCDLDLNALTREKVLEVVIMIKDSYNCSYTDWTKIPTVITTPEAPFLVKYIDDNFCGKLGYNINDLKDKDIKSIREHEENYIDKDNK